MKLKFTHNLFSLILFVLFISWNSIAQISTNGNLNNTIGGENPFMDMSDFSSFANNEGKGLYFPRTDLTIWIFNTGILDGITFSTAYDGMVVYNVGTGQTLAGQGIQTSVSPGYYYFYNPVALGFPDISAGEWLPLEDTKIWKNNLGASRIDLANLSTGSPRLTGTEMVIQDDGKVGIGTDTPTSQLTVSSETFTNLDVHTKALGQNQGTALRFFKQSGAISLELAHYDDNLVGPVYGYDGGTPIANTSVLNSNGAGLHIITPNNTPIVFAQTTNGLTMKLDQNRNVGINNNSPQAKLDIMASDPASPAVTDGILIPRIDNFPATDPTILQDAMMVYLTTTQGANDPGFYYWNNSTTTWLAVSGATGAQKIDDLSDARSDNDGTEDGSSIFFGIGAGANDDGTDNKNIGIGFNALSSNINLGGSIAIGNNALALNTNAANTAIGALSMQFSVIGLGNTALGTSTLYSIGSINPFVPSNFNTAIGTGAIANATNSYNNTAVGYNALINSSIGGNNTAIGIYSLENVDIGSQNTSIGSYTGRDLTGSNNLLLGYKVDVPDLAGDNQLTIGNLIYGTGIDGEESTISTGNIGIGVKSPTEKLEVAGNIYASGGGVLLTDTGVYADYVFENYTEGSSTINKEYTFKTLEEVDTFVKANKHLPGVTGINELKKTAHGYVVNITALSGQLLEKVEELFLHTIAQQKTINKLTEENNNLKARLEKIEAALGIE